MNQWEFRGHSTHFRACLQPRECTLKKCVLCPGFGGIHDPGGGRRAGKLSLWDTLHPGRRWAPKQAPGRPIKHVRNLVTKHLRERFGTLSGPDA